MCNHKYPNFKVAIASTAKKLQRSGTLHTRDNWQGDINPGQKMLELFNAMIAVPLDRYGHVEQLVEDIKPDLPWADHHFGERIGNCPVENPPQSSKIWAHTKGNHEEFKKGEIFDHTYPERFWPDRNVKNVRYTMGNLDDVTGLLIKDVYTRRAFLPIWFPEDTGAPLDRRVPCTLGYHFIVVNGYLHINYYMRSVDFLRHFRNDIYLAVLLHGYVLNTVNNAIFETKPNGIDCIKPGLFTMFMTNLHVFQYEQQILSKHYTD